MILAIIVIVGILWFFSTGWRTLLEFYEEVIKGE